MKTEKSLLQTLTSLTVLLLLANNTQAQTIRSIFISDTSNYRIQSMDFDGNVIMSWGSKGSGVSQFSYPGSIAAGMASGLIYVADTGNNRLQVFDTSGNWRGTWGGPASSKLNGGFSSPNSIAVIVTDGLERVVVADTGNNRIQVLNADGTWAMTFGSTKAGSGIMDYNNPQGVAVDTVTGLIYVCDTLNNRVKKLDAFGNALQIIGGIGSAEGKFNYPRAAAIDSSGRVYVADANNYRVQRFSREGAFELKWGSKGAAAGQFGDIYGISVDSEGYVYVADAGNNRVQKFNSDGLFEKSFGAVKGPLPGQFNYPEGVAVFELRIEEPTQLPVETFTATETFTETPADTETFTETQTNTEIFTETPTNTETFTETPTNTETFTETPTNTETFTETPVDTETFTQTPTETATVVVIIKETATVMPTQVPTTEITPATTAVKCMHVFRFRMSHDHFTKLEKIYIELPSKGHAIKSCEFNMAEKGCNKSNFGVIADNLFRLFLTRGFPEGVIIYCGKCGVEYAIDTRKKCARVFVLADKNPAPIVVESRYETLDPAETYNYPNPCRDFTTIRFPLKESCEAGMLITDINNKPVWAKTLTAAATRPGINEVVWNLDNERGMKAASGVYLIKVSAQGKTITKKMVILK